MCDSSSTIFLPNNSLTSCLPSFLPPLTPFPLTVSSLVFSLSPWYPYLITKVFISVGLSTVRELFEIQTIGSQIWPLSYAQGWCCPRCLSLPQEREVCPTGRAKQTFNISQDHFPRAVQKRLLHWLPGRREEKDPRTEWLLVLYLIELYSSIIMRCLALTLFPVFKPHLKMSSKSMLVFSLHNPSTPKTIHKGSCVVSWDCRSVWVMGH